jgi:hypothetical protein
MPPTSNMDDEANVVRVGKNFELLAEGRRTDGSICEKKGLLVTGRNKSIYVCILQWQTTVSMRMNLVELLCKYGMADLF